MDFFGNVAGIMFIKKMIFLKKFLFKNKLKNIILIYY